ncbi:hypothetical protein V6N12_068530 [Hibiscus sabdariffa]|uniref:C2 domain-containing protein n=1 Tax=Hibiscus sabdariffa TaxID=183260 RepID=A0ABR2FQQ7_9ROSI
MPRGSLEVFLVSAKGLEDMDIFGKMDPYVIMTLRTQEQKSSVASGQGSEPAWNENFLFNVSEGAEELKLKIMDSDVGSEDFVGEAEIPLRAVFREGTIPPTSYNVQRGDHGGGRKHSSRPDRDGSSSGSDDERDGGRRRGRRNRFADDD